MGDLRTEIEIFPHDELGAWRAQAKCGQVGRRDAQWVHVRSQVTASLSRTRHQRLVQIRWYTIQRFALIRHSPAACINLIANKHTYTRRYWIIILYRNWLIKILRNCNIEKSPQLFATLYKQRLQLITYYQLKLKFITKPHVLSNHNNDMIACGILLSLIE